MTTDNSGYSDDLPISGKLGYAANCIEILGQILRNFTGSLPGNQKLAILKATYLLGLRMARALLVQMAQVTVSTKEVFEASDPETRNKKMEKQLERLLTVVAQLLGLLVINKISNSIGSSDIEADAYSTTLEAIGSNPATELVNLAILLDHAGPDDYPFNLIKNLRAKLSNNLYAQRLLADLVVGNMKVFDIGREMRQRMLAVLGIKTPDEAILSKRNKRLR